jgi:hypothetical protein
MLQAPLEVTRFLISVYPKGLSTIDNDENLPVHLACQSDSSTEIVQLLIDSYSDSAGIPDRKGDLPSDYAHRKEEELVKASLELINDNANEVEMPEDMTESGDGWAKLIQFAENIEQDIIEIPMLTDNTTIDDLAEESVDPNLPGYSTS